jgi:hypothetical protein
VLAATDDVAGWTVTVTADRCDSVGCLVWEFGLSRKGKVPPAATLQAWADRAADRVTALMEPLKVVEVDVVRNEALLRSAEPRRRGDKSLYYEILLRGSASAVVCRYQGSHASGSRREQIAFVLTHEALAKLADDLAAD